MRVVEVRPGRAGPVLLCCDGLAGTWPDWRPLADALPDCRIVAVVRDQLDLDNAVAEVIAALDALGLDRGLLVGHSMGGFVIEAAARLHPGRVSGLVFLDGSVTPADPVLSVVDKAGGFFLAWTAARVPVFARIAGAVKRALEPGQVRHDPERRALVDPFSSDTRHWWIVARELGAYQDWAARLDRIRWEHPLGAVGVTVVTAVRRRAKGRWLRRQAGWVQRLRTDPGRPSVAHRIIRSGHLLHLAAPAEVAALFPVP